MCVGGGLTLSRSCVRHTFSDESTSIVDNHRLVKLCVCVRACVCVCVCEFDLQFNS